MHNELNDNSSTPEKATTHHYDKTGNLIITDVLQYFQDSIENPEIYSFRLHFTETKDAAVSIIYANKPGALSAALTVEQSEALWYHVMESKHELESTFGVPLEIREPPTYARRHFSLTKKSRISADGMITQLSFPENYTYKQVVYDFLESAYVAGINIIIEGKTYSGRSRLLNTIMDSAKDYKPTVLVNTFPEMLFGADHREITEIRSNKPAGLIRQVLRMTPFRVVMDDVFVDEKTMETVVAAAMAGTQFVATGYTTPSALSTPETDHLSSYYAEHPYELRVHVDISWNDDQTKLESNILSISQIVHQKIGKSDTTSNRLLFDRDHKVAEPTRTLRRKMDAVKATPPAKPIFVEKPVPTFVSISPEEQVLLEEYREALREHFKTQNVLLRAKFREIDRILEKFQSPTDKNTLRSLDAHDDQM